MIDILKVIGTIILIFLVIVIVFAAIGAAITPLAIATCNAQTKDIGLLHKYNFWGGCLVQENGNWIPLDNWRYIGDK